MSDPKYISQTQPFRIRLYFFCRIWLLKVLARLYIWTRLYITPSKRVKPTYLKSYAVRPSIKNRVFIPKDYKADSGPLPLLIDIHGGGFAFGHPFFDDRDNVKLANVHGICVVAIGYGLSPQVKWPGAVHDCAALIQAVLDDPDLPVDKSKVAVGGYSAGGNLALCSVQLNGLNKKVKAVVAIYPATNSTILLEEKVERAVPHPERKDILKANLYMFHWAYVKPGIDKRSPLLSPYYAERNTLPEHVYLSGCEYDMLCAEAEDTAEKYAQDEKGEKVVDKTGQGWTKGKLRWRKVMGAQHGFNQFANRMAAGSEREMLYKATTDMHADIARWLKEGAYA